MTAPDSAWLRPLVDLALAISTLELLWLLAGPRRQRANRQNPLNRQPWPARLPLLANLGAGLLLMLALRLALHGTAAWVIALCLAAAGLAHAMDLRCRLPPTERKP